MSVSLSSLYTYMFAGLCACLAGVASQVGDADSSRAPGLISSFWTEPGVLACTLQFTVILKKTLRNVYGVGSPTVGTTSSVGLHICAVTCVTEISLHVTLNTNVNTNFLMPKQPFGEPPILTTIWYMYLFAWGNFLCLWTFFLTAAQERIALLAYL